LKRLLEKNGYQVVTAETGKKGLQQLRNSSFDAALMDTELPDIRKNIEDINCEYYVFFEKTVYPARRLMNLEEKHQRNKDKLT
jgi:DNA-binding NtrC family response regulator